MTMRKAELNRAAPRPSVRNLLTRTLAAITLILVTALALLVAVVVLPGLAGLTPLIVVSGSMEPALHVGDIVVTRRVSPGSLKVDDVVTYRLGASLNTHRIIRIEETPQGRRFEVKGDANATPDGELVPPEQVIARVVYSVPKMGFVVAFANSPAGLTLFIVGPAVVLTLMWYREREMKKARSRGHVANRRASSGAPIPDMKRG